jgi:mannose-6-phosphate isomerase-like protein (cupin superfamily)
MLAKKDQIPQNAQSAPMGGTGWLLLDKMSLAVTMPGVIKTFAKATLAPGGEVGYHIHSTDSEAYYILSGEGDYTEGGVTTRVSAGDVTYTPMGEGHGIKNVGEENLEFIALILNV